MTKYWIWICVAGLAILEVAVKMLLPKIKGATGEASVGLLLSKLDKEKYVVVHNVMLRTEKGTTQVDYIVVSTFGLFVIEVKNYNGWILGSEKGHEWTQSIYGKKHKFMNPIHQNYGHVKALEKVMSDMELRDIPMYSIITFPGTSTLKVKCEKENVVYWAQLVKRIRKLSVKEVLGKSQINQILEILQNSNIDSKETRREHVEEIQRKKVTVIEAKNSARILVSKGVCPKCGGKLVKRSGKYGEFYGCSNYPICRFTKNS